jgi:predicted heme/steroid binding protein
MSNNPNRRAGRIYFKVDGTQYDAKGSFSYNLGADKRDGIVGADGVHGYKAMPQVPFIEGAVTDRPVKEPAAQKRPKFRSVSKVLAPRR